MSTDISSSDFIGQWSLSFAEIDFINSKPAATRIGLASQLKSFSTRGFFADDGTLIPNDSVEYLAEQIGIPADELSSYDFCGRSARRHCAEILQYLGYRRMTRGDREALSRWIIGELCPSGQSVSTMLEAVFFCAGIAVSMVRLPRSLNGLFVRSGNNIWKACFMRWASRFHLILLQRWKAPWLTRKGRRVSMR